jgi:UDP-N-acetylglucosamine:LPS N-acetylglucosamine transferase
MILLPIENHAEQWANAKQIEVMGLGKIVNKKYLSDEILNMKKSLNKYNENYKKIKKENIDDYLKKLF